MKENNQLISDINIEEAAVIAGAISGYLKHRNFSIKSVKFIDTSELYDNKTHWKKKFSFSTWRNHN
jgi:hypothetical protein